MGTTRLRRPPAPTDAERARSIAVRGGQAALVGTGAPDEIAPLVHHVRADGSAVLLLHDDEPILGQIAGAPRAELPVMLEITDPAPVELREMVRGLLWITGWLRLPDRDAERRLAVRLADERPHPSLLDLGHGARLVRLHPGSAVLSDAEGRAALSPAELAGARPDPFARMEQHWLAHLEHARPDVLDALARHLPTHVRAMPGARIRPLGVDRCGLRLRIETPWRDRSVRDHGYRDHGYRDHGYRDHGYRDNGFRDHGFRDHDVRLAWPDGATTIDELGVQLRKLVGCPLRG